METLKEVAREMGLKNGDIQIRQKVTIDEVIDCLARNRVYIPSIKVLNKAEALLKATNLSSRAQRSEVERSEISPQGRNDTVYISAENDINLDKLRELIWEKLNLARIYLVKRDEEPSEKNSIIVNSNFNLKQVAEAIGSEFAADKESAKIWGNGAKFNGQTVSLKMKVEEGMMVRFV
jgi:hypothetical protein